LVLGFNFCIGELRGNIYKVDLLDGDISRSRGTPSRLVFSIRHRGWHLINGMRLRCFLNPDSIFVEPFVFYLIDLSCVFVVHLCGGSASFSLKSLLHFGRQWVNLETTIKVVFRD
jgi:hypothetical protein